MKMEVVIDVCVSCGWWLVVEGEVADGCGGGSKGCPWGQRNGEESERKERGRERKTSLAFSLPLQA